MTNKIDILLGLDIGYGLGLLFSAIAVVLSKYAQLNFWTPLIPITVLGLFFSIKGWFAYVSGGDE